MHTFPIHTTSPARFCSSVYETYHAEDYARDRRNRSKLRMQILIQSAGEEKIKEYAPNPDKR
jgi:sulfite reductase beta subunit-like hemoprotein